ncbi:MAG TPA: DHA2 family efflux MFS transporter permease subunit [Thermomicrobiales bacterium]|nr:DHA2 family efflux MFS transporter permease subunit [Thermomicrobiales bacterium]
MTAPVSSPDLAVAKRTAWTLIVGGMAAVFDSTIVSIALHTLASELTTSVDVIQWVITAYLLALGVAVPTVAWAQRRIGGKRLWMLALTIFLIGSVLCSLAWNAQSLIAFRVVQGIGAGIMLPLMATLVVQAAGGQQLGNLMATVSLPIALGPILGPVIGGIILNFLTWHWLFLVNVPFCIAGLALAWRFLPDEAPSQTASLDVIGLGLLSPAIVGLLYGLGNSNKPGGFGRTDAVVPLVIGIVLLAIFIAWSRMRGKSALIDISLFRHWPLSSAFLLLFFTGIAIYGAMLLLPLYFQDIRDADVLRAGLLLIPQGLGTFFSRTIAGKISDQIGARWVAVVGFVIIGLGTIPFAMATGTTPVWVLLIFLFVRGFGLGAVTIPVMAVAFQDLAGGEVPEASILTRLASQIGGSFGAAVFAAILTGAIASGSNGVDAFQHAFWWATSLTAIAAVLALALPGGARHVQPGLAPKNT